MWAHALFGSSWMQRMSGACSASHISPPFTWRSAALIMNHAKLISGSISAAARDFRVYPPNGLVVGAVRENVCKSLTALGARLWAEQQRVDLHEWALAHFRLVRSPLPLVPHPPEVEVEAVAEEAPVTLAAAVEMICTGATSLNDQQLEAVMRATRHARATRDAASLRDEIERDEATMGHKRQRLVVLEETARDLAPAPSPTAAN